VIKKAPIAEVEFGAEAGEEGVSWLSENLAA
jgi:hypothetical protein